MKKLLITLLGAMCICACVGCVKQEDDFVDMKESYKTNSPYQKMFDKIKKNSYDTPDAIDYYLETLITKEDLADGEYKINNKFAFYGDPNTNRNATFEQLYIEVECNTQMAKNLESYASRNADKLRDICVPLENETLDLIQLYGKADGELISFKVFNKDKQLYESFYINYYQENQKIEIHH